MKTNIVSAITQRLFGLLKTEPIKDQSELLQVCTGYAVLALQHKTLTAKSEAEQLAVAERHEQELLQLNAEMKHHHKRIKAWALLHKADPEVFHGTQTFLIGGHELKFHESPGKVQFADGVEDEDVVEKLLGLPTTIGELTGQFCIDHDNENILDMVAENERLRDALLRIKAELDKKAVARFWRQSETDSAARQRLTDLGLNFVKETSFEFNPAIVALPETTKQKEAA